MFSTLLSRFSLSVFSFVILLISFSAQASHFRGGSISWQAAELDGDGLKNDVTITVVAAWALNRAAQPNLNLTPSVTVTPVTNNLIIIGGTYELRTDTYQVKDLDLNTAYLISYSSNARISNLVNNANGPWNIQASIFLKDDNLAPKIDLPILFDVPRLQADGVAALTDFTFQVNTADPNADSIRYRLANTSEMGGGSNPTGFAINANTGVVTWTGSGALASGLYSAGIIVEDFDSTGAIKSKSGADFILDLQNLGAVQFTTSGAIPASRTIVVNKGDTFSFGVSSATSNISSASLGDLSGTLTEPTPDNYEFTPGPTGSGLAPGTYPVTIEIVDADGLTTNSYLALTFVVADPNAPTIANIEDDSVTYSTTTEILIDASTDAILTDADDADLNGGSLKLQVIFEDSEWEVLGITSVGDGVGEIRVTGSEVFYEGNKIGDINSIENGAGIALQIEFNSANATLAAVQALIRSLNYTDTFLLRDVSVRGLTLAVTDGNANGNTYRVNVDVQSHPSAPLTGSPLQASNRITLQNLGSVVLTTSQLRYVDPDGGAPASITLNASSITNGRFELVTNTGVAITSFTQAQVNNGLVQFVHTVSNTLPTYSISADDGFDAATVPAAASIFFSVTSTDTVSMPENQTLVSTVTSLVVTVPTAYSIVSGDDRTLFSINASTGELSFINNPNAEFPADADTNGVYIVDIRITDGQVNDIQTLSITVTDVNDNVVTITSNGGGATAAINVDENIGAVTTVVAVDDITSVIVYSIAGGVDQAAFNINSSTGVLTLLSLPDFETPADSDGNNTYIVDVVADVSGVIDTQTITLTIQPLNDESPVFTSGTTFTADEGGTAVAAISATDADSSGLTYTLTGGLDQVDFSITSAGVLSFVATTDFENPADSNQDNSYSVQVTVSDGLNTTAQNITVNVQNIDEAPEFTSATTFSPNEGGTAIGSVTATDVDSVNLTYTISGGADQNLFGITTAGVLSFNAETDFENPADNGADNTYNIEVSVTDGTTAVVQVISINVQNVDEAPVFTSAAIFTPSEGNTAIGNVTAQDPEAAGLTYTLTGGADQSDVSISTTGVLSFIGATDFENPADSNGDNSYTFNVTVNDGANPVVQSITVNVQAVNDEVPVFTSASAFSPDEGGTGVGSVTATDTDSVNLTYSISGGADQNLFNISTAGVLSFNAAADFENPVDNGTDNIYDVEVTVTDGLNPAVQTISVSVQPVDEPPAFTSAASFTPSEGDTAVATITAEDPESGSVIFSITGGADQGDFSISPAGVLSFNTVPDFNNPQDSDTNNSYLLEVTVTDGSNPSVQSITVSVQEIIIPDSDNDNVPDVYESPLLDSDGDGTPDSNDEDSDGDGIADGAEIGLTGNDTDNDGIDDLFDVDQTGGTDANGDGFDDAPQFTDADADGIPDYLDRDDGNAPGTALGGDSDGDGVPDQVECPAQPCADTDGDSIPDYADADSLLVSPDLEEVDTGLKGVGSFNPLFLLMFALLRFAVQIKQTVKKFMAVFLMLAVLPASAADDELYNWYLGAGVGLSTMDPDTSNTIFAVDDDTDTGYKVFAGYVFNKNWSAELSYNDLGTTTMQTFGEIDYSAFGLAARFNVFAVPLAGKNLTFFFKAGIAALDTEANIPINNVNSSQIFYGGGAEYALSKSLFIRAELESFDEDASLLSLNIVKYFGKKSSSKKTSAEKLTPPKEEVQQQEPEPAKEPAVFEEAPSDPVMVAVLDADEDGIADVDDACPNSKKDDVVDEKGCSLFKGQLESIQFATGSDQLTENAKQSLSDLAVTLASYPLLIIEVQAYTDSHGKEAGNLDLSNRRAQSVVDYLITKDIPDNRLVAKGYGEASPVADNETAEGRKKNRRVEFKKMNE